MHHFRLPSTLLVKMEITGASMSLTSSTDSSCPLNSQSCFLTSIVKRLGAQDYTTVHSTISPENDILSGEWHWSDTCPNIVVGVLSRRIRQTSSLLGGCRVVRRRGESPGLFALFCFDNCRRLPLVAYSPPPSPHSQLRVKTP
jgi:hypothetical protein